MTIQLQKDGINSIKDQARAIFPELVRVRRRLHRFPELGFDLEKTSRVVKEFLENLDIPVMMDVGRSGVVGLIEGTGQGPVVALRADMDALPVQEENEVEYRSQIQGAMHACGHDAHTACLLGAAKILVSMREQLQGTVKLIFQPAEEIDSGAQTMIDNCALEDPKVNAIFGLHTFPGLPAGIIGVKSGPLMASIDNFRIVVDGKSVHGGMPDQGVDSILIASSVIQELQSIVSRNVNPLNSAVVSVGMMHAGTAENILAAQAELRGTVRSLDPEIRKIVLHRLEQIVEHTCLALGGVGRLEVRELLPVLVNDPVMTEIVRQSAVSLFGVDALQVAEPTMGGEDFSLFLQHVPGCYFWLGSTVPGTPSRPWHSSRFDLDERILSIGSALLAQISFSFTRSKF